MVHYLYQDNPACTMSAFEQKHTGLFATSWYLSLSSAVQTTTADMEGRGMSEY